jgi:Catalase-related immune-responsive
MVDSTLVSGTRQGSTSSSSRDPAKAITLSGKKCWLISSINSEASSTSSQEHLVDNLTADLLSIDRPIQQRVVENRANAEPEVGRLVAECLKL